MFKLKYFSLLGLFLAVSISSCTMNKSALRQSDDVHSVHNGKYIHCSLCNPDVEQVKHNEVPEQVVANTTNYDNVFSPHALDLTNVDPYQSSKGANTGIWNPRQSNSNIQQQTKQASNWKMNLSKFLVKSGIKKGANDDTRVEPLGLAGFIIGIVGMFMPLGLGLLMCILAIIFGAVSLGKIRREPTKYRGRGFAMTSLILGIVGVGVVLIVAALLV